MSLSFVGRILLLVLIAVLVVPVLVTLPPVSGTVAPGELAPPGAVFVDAGGVFTHCTVTGSGEPALVLLHGFGASVLSWEEVLEPLGQMTMTVAYDRPGFGLTHRPPREEQPPDLYSPQGAVDHLVATMDALDVGEAVLVGHSAGGTVALHAAGLHPERVRALVLVAPAAYRGRTVPELVRPLLRTPHFDLLGPLALRYAAPRMITPLLARAWHDEDRITDAVRGRYTLSLGAHDWDRGLWELVRSTGTTRLDLDYQDLEVPALVITGDDDRIIPLRDSVRLAGELPEAELVVIPFCGHVPHEERPRAFLESVVEFLERAIEGP